MRLRNRVKARREELGLTKSYLARRAGISRQTLAPIEQDDGHEPLASIMTALVTVLDDPGLFWWESAESETVVRSSDQTLAATA
jgi:transcriptional regulator with XRE-family HTH domain